MIKEYIPLKLRDFTNESGNKIYELEVFLKYKKQII